MRLRFVCSNSHARAICFVLVFCIGLRLCRICIEFVFVLPISVRLRMCQAVCLHARLALYHLKGQGLMESVNCYVAGVFQTVFVFIGWSEISNSCFAIAFEIGFCLSNYML